MKYGNRDTQMTQTLEVLRHELRAIAHYLNDPEVQEVMINSPEVIFVERLGKVFKAEEKLAPESLKSLITAIGNVNEKKTSVLMDARLPGFRIAATLPPVAVHGAALCIRKHSSVAFTFDDYISQGSFTPIKRKASVDELGIDLSDVAKGGNNLSQFFVALMQSRLNFVITGSTSSGKTAFLNLLAKYIPEHDRVVTIEDTAELQLAIANWLAFEANASYGIDVRSLVKHALRNRPTRIIVGEARGSEFFDILDAYNTGHPGSAVTFHSNSAAQALPRLENMIRMAPEASNWPLDDLRQQIASTFTFVIHCSNVGGVRGPCEVLHIKGASNGRYELQTLFKR